MNQIEKIENETNEEKKKKSFLQENFLFLLTIIFILILRLYVFSIAKVDGYSMEPLLQHNDFLIINKISYRFNDPKIGDVIVIPYHYNPKQKFIKRIIAGPKSTIDIVDGEVFVDGEKLKEPYLLETMQYDSGNRSFPITLEDDEYFVMGDNRNHSSDSRFSDVGNIKRKEIIGKAEIRIYPINKKYNLKLNQNK